MEIKNENGIFSVCDLGKINISGYFLDEMEDEKPKKNIKDCFPCVDPEVIDCVLNMHSHGIYIVNISEYVKLSEREVNCIIDAYIDCL